MNPPTPYACYRFRQEAAGAGRTVLFFGNRVGLFRRWMLVGLATAETMIKAGHAAHPLPYIPDVYPGDPLSNDNEKRA